MKKREKFFVGLILMVILTVIVLIFDGDIIRIVSSSRMPYLDYWFLSVGFASNILLMFFFLTSLFLWDVNKRRWILPLWLSSFLSLGISVLLKIIFERPRPFQAELINALQIGLYFLKDNFMTWNFSFPSFQAVLVFSALPILNKNFKKFKYVWLIFACLVAFSRVYFGLHYLSDVLAGAIIGYLIGMLMVWFEGEKGWGVVFARWLKLINE